MQMGMAAFLSGGATATLSPTPMLTQRLTDGLRSKYPDRTLGVPREHHLLHRRRVRLLIITEAIHRSLYA